MTPRRRLNELLVSLEKGVSVPRGRLTVAAASSRKWLDGYVRPIAARGRLRATRAWSEHHLIPALGHIQLKQLQPQAIQAYYGKAVGRLSPGR